MDKSPRPEAAPENGGTLPAPAQVTRLLEGAAAGKRHAARDLLPLVYRSLRGLAERHMCGERRRHTLQTTALVHEAHLRLTRLRQQILDLARLEQPLAVFALSLRAADALFLLGRLVKLRVGVKLEM